MTGFYISAMRRFAVSLCVLLAFTVAAARSQSTATRTTALTPHHHDHDHGHGEYDHLLKYYDKQIYFTQNQGQFSEQVLFRADFPLGQAVATKEGMVISTYDPAMVEARVAEGYKLEEDIKNGLPWRPLNTRMKGHTWRMNFVGASAAMQVESKHAHRDHANYFSGNVNLTNVTSYGEIWYNNVYDNVDVRYYPSVDGLLEYDIVCKPGFDKNKIAIKFDGIERLRVNADGHLVMTTSVGEVDFPAPIVYQKINGKEVSVDAKYVVRGNELRFDLGKFDPTKALVIDPIALRWATWVNTASTGDNHGHCIWVDPTDGAIYMVARVVGTTDQITPGAFDVSANGNLEMIVGKYLEPANVGGSGTRVWQTYIGGNGDDNPYAMEQGPDGNLYITGYTSSSNYPLLGGDGTFGGTSIDQRAQTTDNIFITKINKQGTAIKSSVIGGNGDDGAFDLRINAAGDIVICGNHNSNNLGTLYAGTGAANRTAGTNNVDVIVFKINSDLSSIVWMKNYGGSSTDQATIMLQNLGTGDIFVGGYTSSTNFPTVNPRAGQSTLGGNISGFLQKLKANGNTVWSSYFQSAASKSSQILCMEFNTNQTQLYFGGITNGLASSNISASGVYDNSYNSGTNDFFVCRMDTNQNFVAGTYIGGSANEVNMMGLNTDQNNDVYVFGYTNSTNFPTSSLPNTPLQSTNLGSNDKVFFKLNSALSSLIFSTYYGGSGDDYDPVGERGIKFSNCRIYTIVTSASNDIPLTNGALNTTRSSSGVYEPGLVVWANPPDLINNTINDNQIICAGQVPNDIIGSVPSYDLPTIKRNNTTSAHPSFGSAATYQWQTSPDSLNWTNMVGSTNQNLTGSEIGPLFSNKYFRRIIGGDACILAGAADQVVIVKVVSVSTSAIEHVSCTGFNDGSITASSDGEAPFTYIWSTGATTATIENLAPGSYGITVTDVNGCSAANTFEITEPASLPSVTVTPTNPTCPGGGSNGTACANPAGGTPGFTYAWSNGGNTQCINNLPAGNYSVTATDANGCTASNLTTLILPGAPVVEIFGDLDFCENGATTLSANPGLAAYAWSTGETTSNIVVTTAAAFTVTVTDGNGCTASATVNTTVYSNPIVNVSGDAFICNGDTTVLDAGAGFASYAWSNGTTTQTIEASAAGNYNVTVTNENGCTATNGLLVNVFDNPVVTIGGDLDFCDGSESTLDAGSGFDAYSWSTGETSQSIVVNAAGAFSVTVTDGNGCNGTSEVSVVVYTNPTPAITGDLLFCTGDSSVLDAGAGYSTYNWSTGASTQSIVVYSGGSYNVTVTDANGCSGATGVAVSVEANPTPIISGDLEFCAGGSSLLDAGAGYATYAWSNGESTQSIEVTDAGVYTVTVSNGVGCTGAAEVTVNVYTNPLVEITGDLFFCDGSSTTLDPGAGFESYNWSNGETTQSISVNAAGSFSVIVTDANGCTGMASAETDLYANPTPEITGDLDFCSGGSSVIDAGAGYTTYAWSNGETTQSIEVNANGIYAVTVTDENGCSGVDEVSVNVYANPVAEIGGELSFCAGATTELIGSASLSNVWSTGDSTQTIVIIEAGVYSLTVTDANGCSDDAEVTVTVFDNPTPSISGSLTFCESSNTTLDAGAGFASYAWSNGETTQTTVVNTAATFTVTVTDANGCTASASATTSINPNLSPEITGDLAFCEGSSTALNAGTGYATYAWNTGDSTQTVDVELAGIYSVTVFDANGCSGSDEVVVDVYTNPVVEISGDVDFCEGSSTTLIATAGFESYEWNNAATTQSISVSDANVYAVVVTDANGCTGSAEVETNVYANPVPVIDGALSFCEGSETTLSASPGYDSYIWSNGATESSIAVNAAGDYGVTVTDGNGCTGSASISVSTNPLPNPTIEGSLSFCEGSPTTLDAGAGYTAYAWSNGASSQTIEVSAAGSYAITVTDANGCTGSNEVVTAINPNLTPVISGDLEFCAGGSSVLDAGFGYDSYLWSNGATTQTIDVDAAGAYNVSVYDASGCSGSDEVTVIVYDNPAPNIGGDLSFCEGSETTLDAGAGFASYNWSNGASSQAIAVNTAGTFSVTVTDANGCSGSDDATTVVSGTISVSVVSTDASACANACDGTADVTISGGIAPFSVSWSNGASGASIDNFCPGTYTFTVTDAIGCSLSDSSTVVEIGCPPPACTLVFSSTNVTCAAKGTATVSVVDGVGPYTYIWSNGKTTATVNNLVAGTYSVTVTSADGCTASGSVVIAPYTKITAYVTCIKTCPNQCSGVATATVLTGTGPFTYQWSNGGTGNVQSGLCAGVYWVTITDANGCKKIVGTQVVNYPLVSISGTVVNSGCGVSCTGSITQTVSGGGGGPFTFIWNDGAVTKNRWALCAGTYTVTVTSAKGCTGTATYTVIQSGTLDVSLTPTHPLCVGGNGSVASSVSGSAAGPFAYVWSNGATTANIYNVPAGSYSVTVTSTGGCSATASAQVVNPAAVNVSVTGTHTGCTTYGTATASASGGTAPYTYAWSNGKSTAYINQLTAGTYYVTATDANGCTATGSFTVGTAPKVTAYVTCVKSCANQCTGTATVTVMTGTAPFTYQWSNGGTGASQTGLCAGIYWITITDANGCKRIVGTQVLNYPAIAVASTVTNPTGTLCNGAIAQTVTGGGNGYYTYNWSDNALATTKNRWALCAGSYTVTITNGIGCSTTRTYELNAVGTESRADELGSTHAFTNVTAYPNPFSESAVVEFVSHANARATVDVFSVAGVKLATLFDQVTEAGITYRAAFNADQLPAGVYTYRVQSGNDTVYGKLVLTR